MIGLVTGFALLGFGCGLIAKGPLAAAWWRGQATLAEARAEVLEAERDAALLSVAGTRNMYLQRLDRCSGCATCNPEPEGFGDLPDYELGDAP